MDHAEVIELIELAAVEPDGLARLAAGDTPEAAAVAGHLAGCDACASELARTARAATLARQAIRELPDPALRERTLAYVREVGRDRSTSAAAPTPNATAVPMAALPATAPSAAPAPPAGVPSADIAPTAPPASVIPLASRRPWRAWWAVSIAAVLVAAVAGFGLGGAIRPPTPGDDGGSAVAVVQTTIRIAQQPDAVHVTLASATGGQGTGALVYSATSGELAMAVSGLAAIPNGATYACWVEQGGQRQRIGVLYMDGTDGTWAGKVSGLADLTPGTSFGVSLVPAGSATGSPVLLGTN